MSVTCCPHLVFSLTKPLNRVINCQIQSASNHSKEALSDSRAKTHLEMRPDLLLVMLAIFVSCVSFGSVAATPVLMRDAFEAGEPLTEKEFSSAISGKTAGIESDEFIPWDLQHPELLEGDIMPTGKKNAILNSNGLWPNATIPYVISTSFSSAQRQIIAFAMNEYHNKTCIRFVPRTCEANYIRIGKSGQGCWSYVGKIGGGQDVSLDDGCISSRTPGVVMHELMHSAGFWHEHMRPDRDTYVSINLNNVQQRYRGNFNKLSTTQVTTLGLSYDYGSVMHYPKGAFSIDSSVPVIKALIGNPVLGQRAAFSALDLKKINKLYKCAAK